MKVLIMSDSHGLTTQLTQVRKKYEDEVAAIVHCGDSELQLDDPFLTGMTVVGGNCDYGSQFPDEDFLEITGKSIYVTHGHKYGVKSSLQQLYYRALEVKADIVCFGHSHILYAELIDGVLFINPGSIYYPRLRNEKTYVILEINDEIATVSAYDIKTNEPIGINYSFSLAKR